MQISLLCLFNTSSKFSSYPIQIILWVTNTAQNLQVCVPRNLTQPPSSRGEVFSLHSILFQSNLKKCKWATQVTLHTEMKVSWAWTWTRIFVYVVDDFLFGSIRSPPEQTHFKTTNHSITIKLHSFPRILENIHCPRWIFGHLSTQILATVIFWFSFPKACECLLEILSSGSRYATPLPARNTVCLLQTVCLAMPVVITATGFS